MSKFPTYSTIPPGAAYVGASADYGSSHIASRVTSTSSNPDKGLTVFSPETFSQGGLLRIAKSRITPGKVANPSEDALAKGARKPDLKEEGFQIWYEVHGNGPRKVVFIMGLNNSAFGWLNQVEHFAKDERYSLLILDNRGYGNSETPSVMSKYSTSEMAKDVVEVLDHLGWTEQRQMNVVGVSMGGMISLELGKQIPERIASLSLLSTTSGRSTFGFEKPFSASLPPLAGVRMIGRLLGGKTLGLDSDEYRVHRVADTLFPKEWMDQPSKKVEGKTNREVSYEMFLWRFHFTRRQSPLGSFGQIRAATTHRITNAELKKMADVIPSILIATGDWDHLVNPANSKHLVKTMGREEKVTFAEFKGAGHALQAQFPEELNKELEKCFEKGAAKR